MSETATLPQPPSSDVVGTANLKTSGLATFEGDVNYGKIHPATLVDLVDVTGPDPFKNNEDGSPLIRPRLAWLFTLDGREKDGKVALYTSTSLHEKSHFPPTCVALGRPVPAKNEPIRKSSYLGAKVGLLLEPKVRQNGGKPFPKVTKLVPVEA